MAIRNLNSFLNAYGFIVFHVGMFMCFTSVLFVIIQVEALVGQRVVQVACGSRDSQTLVLVEGN